MNLGVKALLSWVNNLKLSEREMTVDDLQDGTVLLKVVYMLKKEPNSCVSNTIEDRFQLIADFVERDCRFNAAKGTSLSWDNIKDGIHLTVEIAKVLLLLVYHDIMNDRCTLNMMESNSELEIANLTGSYVMESDGCVYLNKRLDAYLERRHMSVYRETFERSATASSSNVSTMSSLSDDDSPVFHRRQKVSFMDMQTVASPLTSNSPLQDIMNTPKFQLRKMERQMIKERDYKDGLERELASRLELIAQKESHICQLQYRMEKLKEANGNHEHFIGEQIIELRTKNNTLQMRLNEMLKENKDLKGNTSLMERKVDELADENGILSSQMRTVCSQLAIFEAEVARLTQTQASSQEEWTSETGQLQSELNQATAQKELLTEEIQILQGKISCLEDDLNMATKEEAGENMGPIMERDMLDNEIIGLKVQVQSLNESLRTTVEQVQAKDNLLTQKEIEISQERDNIQKLNTTSERELQVLKDQIKANEEQLVTLEHEGSIQSDMLQQEIRDLKTLLSDMGNSLSEAQEALKAQMVASQDEVKMLNEEICAKKEQFILLSTETSTQSQLLQQDIESLNQQINTLSNSLENAKDQALSKDELLAEQKQQSTLQIEALGKTRAVLEEEVNQLREQIQMKEGQVDLLKVENSNESEVLQSEIKSLRDQVQSLNESLRTTVEQVQAKENLLTEKEIEISQERDNIQKCNTTSERELQVLMDQIKANEEQLVTLEHEGSIQSDMLQQEIRDLKTQLSDMGDSLSEAQEKVQTQLVMLTKQEQDSAEQMGLLQQQLASINAELDQYRVTQAVEIRVKEAEQAATFREKEALVQEKEVLMARILQMEKKQKALEEQHEAVVFEKDRLAQATQAMERDNQASHDLESLLQHEMEILKKEKEILLKEKEKADEIQTLKKDLQEQLSAKSEAAEHYKAQMEKAMSHYNGKKQLLQESQEEAIELKQSLEVKECEINASAMDNKLLQLDLEKAQTNEKALLSRVASLEAQLAFAERNLRAQNKFHGNEGSSRTSLYMEVADAHSSVNTKAKEKKAISSDSLDHSSLEDSLNNTRKLLAPDESSTPLVRSSERLAAKHRRLQAESLETLYFTPINSRQINRINAEHTHELDSTRKNPSSSVKRRRTTQKTPGGGEHDDTFYSLASARSHPNLSSAHSARPVPMELLDTPARLTGAASDQLIGLPGYRRSTMHSQPASTFCAGAENEPDCGPDDWMRIAELQGRNKAVLPHLKSSYPVESDPCRGATFLFTDEELRTGDPSDTIRRASTMPGQLKDSLASHRHSLMVGHSAAAANARSHRLSLMSELPSKTVSSRSPKGTKRSSSTLSVHQTSPEKKVRASCFPRPLTPKAKNVMSEPFNSQIRTALSPVDRRQSMMFSIDNTPQKNNFLTKNINKLRSSTRKFPGKSSKKSPAQKSVRKCQENNPAADSRAGMARTGNTSSFKSPQVATKGQKATSRSAKSPGPSSARKKRGSGNDDNLCGSVKR